MTIVLIIDDESSSRSVLRDLILPDAYEVVEAASGPEGLAAAAANPPHVIITDLMMPGMDGLEVCRRLRASEATRSIPIIVVTALDSRKDLARALDAGATDFIAKPVSGVEVRARVRSMVRIAREHATLQQLLALRTDLTNMVIHDLRNPLQVISWSAALMQRVLPEPHPVALQRIRTSVVRLQLFIDDLLVVARSEAGVLVVHRSEFNARQLVEQVLEDCGPTAESGQIQLYASGEAQSLEADAVLLRRCLENLVLNAIKFSPRQTNVTVEILPAGSGVIFKVIDEGPGVPEALRESVFDRFVTSEQKDRRTRQTGLGLAFCRMVAEAHQGTIEVQPSEGTGSIFRLWLPGANVAAGEA